MCIQSDSSGLRKRMVIVVPTLTHSKQSVPIQIRSLNACIEHAPRAWSRVVGEVGDDPMTSDAHRDSHADTPDNPTPASYQEEDHTKGYLLQHPSAVEKSIEGIVLDT